MEEYLEGKKNISDLVKVYSLVNGDYGTYTVLKRFKDALRNVKDGYYKNPFFYYGIKNPDTELDIIEKYEVPKELVKKYHLNAKQQSAVKKAINTNSVFYLQGPPGTGKTQTISAITD